MDTPNIVGLTGAFIAGAAYFPQISHLVKEKCSAGISRIAYALWFTSSLLITTSAIFLDEIVFIVLGIVQILSTAIIYIFSTKYRGQVCETHQGNPGKP